MDQRYYLPLIELSLLGRVHNKNLFDFQYSIYIQTVVPRRIGMSTGPIWLDQVNCIGNETSLDQCMHFDWSESNCNHTEDVSVRCSYGMFLPHIFIQETK